MRVFRFLSLIAPALLIAGPLHGQVDAGTPVGARVSGLVTDSLASKPLNDAAVQLVMTGTGERFTLAAMTDAEGIFEFPVVPEGDYLIGFLHPVLDSLGLEPIVRALSVRAGQQEIRADLATPGPGRLKEAFCGTGFAPDGGLIIGFVRSSDGGAALAGATVLAEWLEMSIRRREIGQQTARRAATSGENGSFVLCDVPSPGSVVLQAELGLESADRLEIDVPASGLIRRDLYLGEEYATDDEGWTPTADRMRITPAIRTGNGRLTGKVIAADGGWPLPGATVRVVDGVQTETDSRGEWILTGAPSGTRVLEVLAPNYLSVHRTVDIIEGAGPVYITLPRLAAVLDTLRVVARSRSNLAMSGFEQRRRSSGAGHFLTAEDIARFRLWNTSRLFDFMPGLRRTRASSGEEIYLMSSVFGGDCVPDVFINGLPFQNLVSQNLDELIQPRDIAGMEVYREPHVPAEFRLGMSGCGSVVVWTK
jgi:hypothetical protein